MKRQQKRRSEPGARPSGRTWQNNNVSEMIRAAEKSLSEGRYDVALERLQQARALDPSNQYIDAIIVRAQNLRSTQISPVQGRDPALEGSRYLSVTVGREFSGGIRPDEGKSAEQIRLQIRQLTDTATVLLSRGLSESAFDSLMKAYLLDPMNPDVIACETRVLPAWEKVRASHRPGSSAHGGEAAAGDSGRAGESGKRGLGLNLLKTLRGKA